MGKYKMVGDRTMRIMPEGAEVVIVTTDKDGKPNVEFLYSEKKEKKEDGKTNQSAAGGKKKAGFFDPFGDDDEDGTGANE
jgi:hypothetical protein